VGVVRRRLTTPVVAFVISVLASVGAYAALLGGVLLYVRWQSWDTAARHSRVPLFALLIPAWILWGAGVWAVFAGSRSLRSAASKLRRGTRALACLLRVAAIITSVFLLFNLLFGWRAGTDAAEHAVKGLCHDRMQLLLRLLILNDRASEPLEVSVDEWSDWALSCDIESDSLLCPAIRRLDCGYALNMNFGRYLNSAVENPDLTLAIFESDAGWNAVGGPQLLPDEPRHFGGDNYGFADGSVRWLPRKKLGTDSRGNPIWAKEPDADWVIWEPVLKDSEGEQTAAPDP